MPPRRPNPSDALFPVRAKKAVPYPFVLDAIEVLSPETRPFFGCRGVYVGDQIVLILREKHDGADDGVWLATAEQHHESLRREFPNMRSIGVFGRDVTHWQLLPADAPDFEEAALRACELIVARDPRIGKVPKSRAKKSGQTKAVKAGANSKIRKPGDQ